MSDDAAPSILISEERIRDRVRELAAEISRDFSGSRGLILVGVLRGAFIFLADLARQINVPHALRPTFEPTLRQPRRNALDAGMQFEAIMAVGQRLEPWIEAVSVTR